MCSKSLNLFFIENQSTIEKNYPGINLKILEDSFYNCNPKLNYNTFFEKVLKAEPLEYLTGSAYFYNTSFFINRNVLIPRFETELIVETAKQFCKNKQELNIVDIGTGSGNILISLLIELSRLTRKTKLNSWGIDISNEALEVAKQNYYLNQFKINPAFKINFLQGDRFQGLKQFKFDLILSNPPYIKSEKDRKHVHGQTHDFEPHLALYLDDDIYFNWFNDFFADAFHCLNDSGMILLEGSEFYIAELKKMALEKKFSQAKILNDLAGKQRMLKIIK